MKGNIFWGILLCKLVIILHTDQNVKKWVFSGIWTELLCIKREQRIMLLAIC